MNNAPHGQAVLARVIPLVSGRRVEAADAGARERSQTEHSSPPELARAVSLLERVGGPSAHQLPNDLGRRAAHAQRLLECGPTGVESPAAPAGQAINLARRVLASIDALIGLVEEEGEVLGEALATRLDDLTMTQLRDLVEAVTALGTAPAGAPTWASPSEASAAEIVLAARADDLRRAAASHVRLYAHYTDAVWELPPKLLAAGTRRFRFLAHARLRVRLRAASRTGRLPGHLRAEARTVLATREARGAVDAIRPLLAHHLGALDRGVFTDVDAARDALAAVRSLQAVLADRLDVGRLEWLLLAEAFQSYEVFAPASRLRTALAAWLSDAEGAEHALDATLEDLASWASDCGAVLPALVAGATAAEELDLDVGDLASLVDLLVLREHIEELRRSSALAGRDPAAGSAS